MNDAIQTIDYKGCIISIHHDLDAENPHDWGTLPPMLVYTREGIAAYSGMDQSPPDLTAGQIRANLPTIRGILGERTLLAGVRAWSDLTGPAADAVNDAISYALDSMPPSDRLEALATLYRAVGIPAVCATRHGHTQGDWAEILAVATPEWLEAVGAGPESDQEAALLSSINTFAAWLHGDVYGYTILRPCPCCGQPEPVPEDSCWGFYGDDLEDSGLLATAKEYIDQADY